MRRLLALVAFLFGLGVALPAWAITCPPLPYNLLNGTIVDAVQVMADLNALRNCINGGTGGAATVLPIGEGFTKTPGADNDTPVNLPTDTLYGQAFPATFVTAHNVAATEMSHTLLAVSNPAAVAFTLPSAGTLGFEKGSLVCFLGVGTAGFQLTTTSGTLQGIPSSLNVATLPQYGSACAVSDPPNWDVSAALGSNSGSVSSISITGGACGLSSTPNPITTTGTISLPAPLPAVCGGTNATSYTDGQLLIGDSSTSGLDKNTITAGSGISVTNGHGTITIANTGSGGTVTSVGLTVPGIFSVAGSPVTTAGTLAVSLVSQTQNLAWMSPNGSSGNPLFRTIVAADLPADVAYIDVANVWTAHQNPTPVALTDGGTITPSGTDANLYTLTLTGNTHNLACPSSILNGTYNFRIKQDGTGGRTGFTTSSCYKYPSGTAPTWTTTAGAVDVLSCSAFDNARLECNALLNLQ